MMNVSKCWYKEVCKHTCSSACLRFNAMTSFCKQSNLPEDKWIPIELYAYSEDLEAFETLADIKKNIYDFVQTGQNLYIYSKNCGNGKTSWSIKLLLAYFNSIWHIGGFNCKGVFIHVPTFLAKNKQAINKKDESFEVLLENILKCDLVIWDDIASTRLSEYDHQLLLTYIDSRNLSKKTNIYTGNCDSNGIYQFLGARLHSRIYNEATVVKFNGADKRGLKL